MRFSATVFALVLVFMLVLAEKGMPQQGLRPPDGHPIRQRIRVWQEKQSQRVLASASGQVTPEDTGRTIDVQHPDFTEALRVSSTTSGTENKWAAQLRFLSQRPIAAGDVLVLAVTLRSVQDPGRVFLAFGTAHPPHANSFARYVAAGPQWQEFQFPFLAPQDYPAGAAKVSLGFGAADQQVDVGRVEIFNFQKARPVSDFVNSSDYRGSEPDAAWRQAAWERIETIRKADLRIELVDEGGRPVSDATVTLRMTGHAFRFGSSFNPHVYRHEKAHPDWVRQYERRFVEYFNVATPEAVMSWNSWENLELRGCLSRTMDFLTEHKIPVIGHPLVWQAPKTLPESVHKLLRAQEYDTYLARWNSHLAEKVQAMRGRLCEYLVINEFVDTNFLPERMTDDAILDWYRLVQTHDPTARLGILEHKMIAGDPVDADKNLAWYESKIEMLLRNGIPLNVVAFQGHFLDQLTDPERLLEILDRFARYKVPLQVTEFDVAMDDEELQADYLRDFFLACFSHPSVELIQQWGFWERSHWRPKAALFRADWSAKPNGREFLDLVHNRWKTRATGTTDADGRFTVRGFLGNYDLTIAKAGRVARQTFPLPKAGCSLRLVLPSRPAAAAAR